MAKSRSWGEFERNRGISSRSRRPAKQRKVRLMTYVLGMLYLYIAYKLVRGKV